MATAKKLPVGNVLPQDPIKVKDAMVLMGCTRQGVHDAIKKGKLQAYNTREGLYLSRALVEEYVGLAEARGLAPEILLTKKMRSQTEVERDERAEREEQRRMAELRLKEEELALRSREVSLIRPPGPPSSSFLDFLDSAMPVLILLAGAGVLALEKFQKTDGARAFIRDQKKDPGK